MPRNAPPVYRDTIYLLPRCGIAAAAGALPDQQLAERAARVGALLGLGVAEAEQVLRDALAEREDAGDFGARLCDFQDLADRLDADVARLGDQRDAHEGLA